MNKVIDLSNAYVVLGSGPNAIAAIHGLLKTKKNIYVIDAGITEKSFSVSKTGKTKSRYSSPKFINKKNAFVFNSFLQMNRVSLKNFFLTSTLAKGGLSNVWGGGLLPYNKNNFSKYPYEWETIKKAYPKIYKILTNKEISIESIENKDIDILNLEFAKPLLRDTLLALNYDDSLFKRCSSSSCGLGCLICNKGIYNSSSEIDNLIKEKKIKYLSNSFIDNIKKEDSYYKILTSNTKNKSQITYLAKNIFCSLGAISTTKLVLGMNNRPVSLPLLSTPAGRFIIFSSKPNFDKRSSLLSGKTLKFIDEDEISSNIFPISLNLISSFFGDKIATLIMKCFGKVLISRIYVANIYFSSDYSSNAINVDDGVINISSSQNPKLNYRFESAIKILQSKLKEDGFYIMPFGKKLLHAGEDIHYGGSLPMSSNPCPFECDLQGRLYNEEGFYITDSSSMPYLPGKPHTFNSMAQAYLCTKNFIDREELVS